MNVMCLYLFDHNNKRLNTASIIFKYNIRAIYSFIIISYGPTLFSMKLVNALRKIVFNGRF